VTGSENQTVAVDTDFILHLAEMKNCDPISLARRFFEALRFSPVLNETLFVHELEPLSATVQLFFEQEIIHVLYFIGDLTNEKRVYFERVVRDIYYRLKGDQYPLSSVFSGWEKKSSFGEIHSVAMCILMQLHIFLSDDKDSKIIERIVRNSMGRNSSVTVLTRADAVGIIPEDSSLSRAEKRKIGHQR